MVRYPLNKFGQPYGYPAGVKVDENGYVIGKESPKVEEPKGKK